MVGREVILMVLFLSNWKEKTEGEGHDHEYLYCDGIFIHSLANVMSVNAQEYLTDPHGQHCAVPLSISGLAETCQDCCNRIPPVLE